MKFNSTDLIGEVFGRLTVIAYAGRIGKKHAYLCMCTCGNSKTAKRDNLRSGYVNSCGCYRRELASQKIKTIPQYMPTTHGQSRTKTYNAWINAKTRCFNQGVPGYESYGGRGITMCKRWVDSYEAFVEDMGIASAGMTLERIDVNGHYEPMNCVWADRFAQARNKRNTKLSPAVVEELKSRRKAGETLTALGREFGIHHSTVWRVTTGRTWCS